MYAIVTLAAGLLFGLGLAFSEMTNPTVVLGFLDIFGEWNPSLIIVMASAITVGMIGYAVKRKRMAPMLASKWQVPTLRHIDSKLIIGSSLFGIGWGISGYCPGPGLTALVNNPSEGFYFVAALIVGSGLHYFQTRITQK
ncbi:YeeE/YedE family protein [Marinomonas rhizomae]|uniref:Sulphur transport domain-containing protein n=1 Tax=Marinomonas rhizomae TaxID=491948 RepID=A0A366JEG2_9GAMM|nr:DUF6691 family protein [Marinomonas rhizomae]RBP84675.1 hypothetical protein DFP80_103145 [Marinomonas rhizomae]RNF75121.1 YeeE/YedE family protein [Marinomonas rhizomae]